MTCGIIFNMKLRATKEADRIETLKDPILDMYQIQLKTITEITDTYKMSITQFYRMLKKWDIPRIGKSAIYAKKPLVSKEIVQNLTDQGLTTKEIAEELNIDWHQANYLQKKDKLKLNKRFKPNKKKEEIIKLYQQGKTCKEIEAELGVHHSAVGIALKKWDIPAIPVWERNYITLPQNTLDKIFELARQNIPPHEIATKTGISADIIRARMIEFNVPSTGHKSRQSSVEREICQFLENCGIIYEANSRKIIAPKELDLYIPEHNLAIEYCGLCWHSYHHGGKTADYHLEKFRLCEEKGIRLITLFEDEWKLNPEIVKSRILNFCNKTLIRIHGRKCIISEVLPEVARSFCKRNHIQGSGPTKKAYGLFHNSELVSVMCFDNLSPSKNSNRAEYENKKIWELTRFCSLIHTLINGGAQKLLKQFIREVHPDKIVSFADLRWSLGNIYKQLNFTLTDTTVPNYTYFLPGTLKRYHKSQFRKNDECKKLGMTEWEYNSQIRQLDKIFDCGKQKWVMEKGQSAS